jgi:hypothetical protein
MEDQMKNKYHGLANLIIFGTAIILIICYGLYHSSLIKGSIPISSPAGVPSVVVPEPATLAYLTFLNGRMDSLTRLNASQTPVDLRLFNFDPATTSSPSLPETDTPIQTPLKQETAFSYQVTLTFSSPTGSICMIDGQLYKENATLPDGGQILAIEQDRVLISKNDQTSWVYQASTFEKTRYNNLQLEDKEDK